MRAGMLRQRVTLQLPIVAADGQGGQQVTGYTALATNLPAHVETTSGRELLFAARITTAVISTTVVIRFRSDVSAKGRVLFGTRILQIATYQDPTGLRRELLLLCSEVQP